MISSTNVTFVTRRKNELITNESFNVRDETKRESQRIKTFFVLIINLFRRNIREIFANEFCCFCDNLNLNDIFELCENVTKLLNEKCCREIIINFL